jgi:hypothetical protein
MGVRPRKVRIMHAHFAKVHLQLHHLREVRDVLGSTKMAELIGGKHQRSRDACRSDALNDDGDFGGSHDGFGWTAPLARLCANKHTNNSSHLMPPLSGCHAPASRALA